MAIVISFSDSVEHSMSLVADTIKFLRMQMHLLSVKCTNSLTFSCEIVFIFQHMDYRIKNMKEV